MQDADEKRKKQRQTSSTDRTKTLPMPWPYSTCAQIHDPDSNASSRGYRHQHITLDAAGHPKDPSTATPYLLMVAYVSDRSSFSNEFWKIQ